MLNKIKNRKEEGFTIIEVLIVLAIAGLILLIVFLAVPALNRNNQNTQQRDRAAKVLGAIQETATNANGALPAPSADATAIEAQANLNTTNVRIVAGTPAAFASGADEIQIVTGVKCVTPMPAVVGAAGALTAAQTASMVTSAGASSRDYVAVFTVNGTGQNVIGQCQGS